MLIIKKGFKRRYGYGGSGIMESVGKLVGKVVPFLSNVGQEVAKKQAVELGNKLVERVGKVLYKKNKKSEDILKKYLPLSSMIDGGNIPIQNLVQKLTKNYV